LEGKSSSKVVHERTEFLLGTQ